MSSAAVGAKTARACDYCIRRRARWYCAADDAFLCQGCDGSVHSANSLARRHERVRLNTASLKCSSDEKPCIPSWHRGLQRRARTPRHGKQQFKVLDPLAHVPELGQSTTTSRDDDYEESDHLQLLYRVPVLDPLVAELCSSSAGESKYTELILLGEENTSTNPNDNSPQERFLPLDLDMDMDMGTAEFAADMESFLGKGLEGESCYGIDDPGLSDYHGRGTMPFELSFDYNSPASCEDAREREEKLRTDYDDKGEWRMSLRLDYEAISAAWATQGSPWMISPNDCCFHATNTMGSGDGGREARVSRYREKRRTRLFSKKIRYEVRKLNAERRPRVKGRFVKRSSFNPLSLA